MSLSHQNLQIAQNRLRIFFQYSPIPDNTQKYVNGSVKEIVSSAQEVVERGRIVLCGIYWSEDGGGDNNKQKQQVFPLPIHAGERLITGGRDFTLPFNLYAHEKNSAKVGAGAGAGAATSSGGGGGWKRVKRNIYVDEWWDEMSSRQRVPCACLRVCDDACLNRALLYECADDICQAEYCENRQFYNLGAGRSTSASRLEVFETATRGLAIRALRDFEPGSLICEYTGEIITKQRCAERLDSVYKDHKNYYFLNLDGRMVVDAGSKGDLARFANHSCQPNCRIEKWMVKGKSKHMYYEPRIGIFAGDQGVMAGEEITYDYNFSWFPNAKEQSCRCGTWRCRGVIGKRKRTCI